MKYSTPSYSPFCQICGKPLLIEEHRAQGIGPICAGKFMEEVEKLEDSDGQVFDIEMPISEGVQCYREYDKQTLHFSIPQKVVKHSPTGMEWGYAGSGPADFALNILLNYTDVPTAYYLYQSFKHKFVTKLPREGGTIKAEDIREWLLERSTSEVAMSKIAELRRKEESLFTEDLNAISDAFYTA